MQHSRLFRNAVAKTDRQNPAYGLPLWMHTRDTVGVMQYLWEKWLPDSMAALTGLGWKELRPLLIFLAAMHDVGKISNAFVCQIAENMPDIRLRMEPLQITRRGEEAYRHHTIVGAAIVSSLGVPDWIASVVGAHHGTIMEPMDFDAVMRSGYAYGDSADAPVWQGLWREQLDDALEQAQDPAEAIDAFVAKKLAGKDLDRKQLQKVSAALARRGYSWSDINDALRRYGAETGEDY